MAPVNATRFEEVRLSSSVGQLFGTDKKGVVAKGSYLAGIVEVSPPFAPLLGCSRPPGDRIQMKDKPTGFWRLICNSHGTVKLALEARTICDQLGIKSGLILKPLAPFLEVSVKGELKAWPRLRPRLQHQ